MRSAVLLWKACSMESGDGIGWGRARRREVSSGRRVDIVGGSGGRLRGDKSGCTRVWRRRLWWVRWVVRAMWAVTSLGSRISSLYWTRGHQLRVKYEGLPCCASFDVGLGAEVSKRL